MAFSDKASKKTDDTMVFHQEQFFRVKECNEDYLTLVKIRTKTFNTNDIVKLPWNHVGVRLYDGETSDTPVTVHKNDIKAKAILCGNIISTMYPQWVVT